MVLLATMSLLPFAAVVACCCSSGCLMLRLWLFVVVVGCCQLFVDWRVGLVLLFAL